VTPGYFAALGIPLVGGRTIEPRDDADAAPVVVVNAAFRDAHFPDASPLGRRIALSGATREIVGVVGDVQHVRSFGDFDPLDAIPTVYVPVEQLSGDFFGLVHTWFAPAWIARGPRPPAELVNGLREALAAADPRLPAYDLRAMSEVMAAAWARERTQALLLGALSLLALVLAAVGIHGLVANSVVERRREVGIRIALGSTLGRTVRLFVSQGLRPALLGLLIGSGLALGAARLIRHMLWGVDSSDPWTFAGVAALLVVTAAAASAVPTARIARIAPAETLRDE
jgi:predicted lysophospholipase L1 biosynthesis ABC-type transport system permease subunit